MLLKYTFNASFINKGSVSSSYWHTVQHCLWNKSFPSINLITMSSGPSLRCWKSNLSSFFLCPKYFFFHLLMFSLCKNAILIQQKCYFTRNISLYPNQEGPHWNMFIFLTVKTEKKKREVGGRGKLCSVLSGCADLVFWLWKRSSPDVYWLQIQSWAPNANNIFINSAWPGGCPLFFLLCLGTSLVFREPWLNTISLRLCKMALSLSLLLSVSCKSEKS